jgi:hypothetical protein
MARKHWALHIYRALSRNDVFSREQSAIVVFQASSWILLEWYLGQASRISDIKLHYRPAAPQHAPSPCRTTASPRRRLPSLLFPSLSSSVLAMPRLSPPRT